ncbi:uncharacterized protein [Haliotis asinina]|uniref:uncharacterized protein n=1 Tax=Haliotis asinina TaxID=109174 RepID=UPI003531E32E
MVALALRLSITPKSRSERDHPRKNLLLTTVIVNVLVVLVTSMQSMVRHADDDQLEDLLATDNLIQFRKVHHTRPDPANVNRSLRVPPDTSRARTLIVAPSPLIHEELDFEFEDFLLPTEEDLRHHRRKRQVITEEGGSGSLDAGVETKIVLDVAFSSGIATTIKINAEAVVKAEFDTQGVDYSTVTAVVSDNGNGETSVVFTTKFNSVNNRILVAYVFKNFISGFTIGTYTQKREPTVKNANNVEISTATSTDFFPWGFSTIDNKLSRGFDANSESRFIKFGFTFNTATKSYYSVGDNGILSFGTTLTDPAFNPPDLDNIDTTTEDFICVFCADANLLYAGTSSEVFYGEYQIGDPGSFEILLRATNEVRVVDPTFEAMWVAVITWFDVPYFETIDKTTPSTLRNTFQAVLISDGITSYVLINYKDMAWPQNYLDRSVIGFRHLTTGVLQCCYISGAIDEATSHYLRFRSSDDAFQTEDVVPYDNCCVQNTLCQLFRDVRPNGVCATTSAVSEANAEGDPHITTLDGFEYTFNGYGEYLMSEIVNPNENFTMVIQCRTLPAKTSTGADSKATIFQGFAATETTVGGPYPATSFVEMNKERTKLIIFANGTDISVAFDTTANFVKDYGNMVVRKDEASKVSFYFTQSKISVAVGLNAETLSFEASLPISNRGLAKGLLGNYDIDNTNDLVKKTGETIPSTSTEREIYAFGETWRVSESESILRYEGELTYAQANNASFVPVFLEEIVGETRTKAEEVCGGATNKQCILDFAATGNQALAQSTKALQEAATAVRATLANSAPKLTGTTQVNAEVSKASSLSYSSTDPDGDAVTYVIVGSTPTGVSLNANSGSLVWTPASLDPVRIVLVSEDAKGLASNQIDVQISLCGGCQNGGTCDFTKTRSSTVANSPDTFKLAACTCTTGWGGTDCSTDQNGCETKPCGSLRTCTDVTPSVEASTNKAFTCGPCPAGYQSDAANVKCQDENECQRSTSPCPANSVCTNSVGSFACTCNSGYRKLADGSCADIDECADRSDNCEQKCENTDGSFNCSCLPGFVLNADQSTCAQQTPPPSCATHGCAHICTEVNSSPTCFCRPGYKLAGDNKACEDINECSLNLCSQICQNSDGSFNCSCVDGFSLDVDNRSCSKCAPPKWGPACANTCRCQGRASGCDSVKGCLCEAGWTGINCVTNINECQVNPSICGSRQICEDTQGSYLCKCPTGYSKNGTDCIDINECATGQAGCEQVCTNAPGSYNCGCNDGFVLNDDRKTCRKFGSDPCLGQGGCQHFCIMNNSVPTCQCNRGYTIASDNKACDACDDNHWGLNCANECGCSPLGTSMCDKTLGCVCHSGWTGDKCDQDKNECSTVTCQANSDCQNLPGSYRCRCRSGYSLSADNTTCDNINECANPTDNVCAHDCSDTDGDYTCSCKDGFVIEGKGKCNEGAGAVCSAPKNSTCQQNCRRQNGTDTCFCNPGYTLNVDGLNCDDVKECDETPRRCSQNCAELLGSFSCSCNDGYVLASDRSSCTPCDPGKYGANCAQTCMCDAANTVSCNATDGSCTCRSGWRGTTCTEDIPECTDTPNICGTNGVCNERNGSYACTCSAGFSRSGDTCVACDSRHYGADCSQSCSCDFTKTVSCNAENGTCTCKPQWMGENCTDNVNECSQSPSVCTGSNEQCRDTQGSFECDCTSGHIKAPNNTCVPCNFGFYGNGCSTQCLCVAGQFSSCDNLNGACTCNTGWNDTLCDNNINECLNTATPVCTGFKEVCRDTNGSYACDCETGYYKAPNNTCIDVNECDTNNGNCTYVCNNSPGSYFCSCPLGYNGSGNACTKVSQAFGVYVTFNLERSAVINQGPTSQAYKYLVKEIEAVINSVTNATIPAENYAPATVYNLTIGSVIAFSDLNINPSATASTESLAAAVVKALADGPTVTVGSTTFPVTGVAYNGITIPSTGNECDTLKLLRTLASDEYCEVQNGLPVVKYDNQTYSQKLPAEQLNVPLIVGLTVPISLVAIILFIILIYVCCCKKKATPVRRFLVEERDNHAFRSAFTGNLPTKGNFGASRYMMYSPHTLSETASQSSGENIHKYVRPKIMEGRSDFQDMPGPDDRSYPYTDSRGTHWILVYVVINVFVGTVTTSPPVDSMGVYVETESVDELLEQDFLIRVSAPRKNTRGRPKLNTSKIAPTTERNVRPMTRKLNEFILEDDLLIPIGREGLSREKRQVVVDPDEGSGTPANIVMATVTLDLPFDPLADYSALKSAAEVALVQKYIQADLAFLGLTTAITNNGGKVQVTHNVQFIDRDDRVLVAYALTKYVLKEGMLAPSGPASAPITTDPTVFNAAGTEISTAASSELFPWGFSMCDDKLPKLLPTSFDVVSNLLPIETGFPLGTVAQTTMAVGDNGGVSFGAPYNPNTLTDIMNAISPILCVYCADGDLRNTGSSANVFYQTYPLGKAESIPILERATAEVRTHTANSDYVASWAAVVTWHGLPDFDSTSQTMPNPERNTFQAVLSTDGVESYWQIFYGDMQWVNAERQLSVLGFQPTTGVNPLNAYSRTVGSLASQPTQMDMVPGNTGQNGIWIFNTGTVAEIDPSARQCREWYIRNYPLKSTFVQRAAALPSCPCTLDHMLTMGIYFTITKSETLYCAELIKDGLNEDSKSCCYNIASGGLESVSPLAGNYYRYGTLSNYHAHVTEDLIPLKQCCIDNPSLCPLFQELRPTLSNCLPQPAQRRIGCFGDPHFTTFDGRDFSFNGLGEYTLFTLDYKPQQFKFVLQCRTEVAVRADASTSKATVFTAFAGKQFGYAPTDGGSFHIEMNSNKTKMVVYINGIDRSTLFYDEAPYIERTSTLYATRISTSTIRFTFPVSEVSIDITLSAKSLSFSVALDNRFQGMTKGLLGNFDGNDTNDFNKASGESLPETATERQLFDMGKTWAVSPFDSILRYSPGMSSPDYFNNTFVPLFMDEIDPLTRAAAEVICGTEPSDQCVFDYAVTGDNVLAISTKTIKSESDETQAVLSNSAPTVNGTDSLRVEVGHPVSLEFDGSDAEGDSFKYVLQDEPGSGFTFDPDTGRGSWTPRDSTPVKISLNAEDSRGMKSRLINVKVTLCEGCVHGHCDYLSPQTGVPGRSTCSEDYDGCMSGPCGEGRTCTDEDPAVHSNTGRGYTCSSCPIGYYSNPGDVKCQDVDECLARDDCPHHSMCYNTKGSFICTCLSGYRKNSKGDCVDIDECSEHRNNCSQTCVNRDGGYYCDCLSGFVLNTDGSTCTQVQVPSSCFTFGCAHLCALNEDNRPQCYCEAGFKLGPDGKTCSDMNECGMSLCSQTCVNTDGGYTCSCYSGFYLDNDGYSCTECPFPLWGPSCNNTCECQGHATSCDPVHGCMCVPGWTGVNCAINVNECDLDPTICSSQQSCIDTLGSYQCRCPEGFRKQGQEYINECEAGANPCQDKFQCVNTAGSFSCHCQEGYTQVGQQCVDVDECTNSQARCEQLCVNVPGTYNCLCHYGYDLSDDRKTCEKTAAAACATTGVVSCSHYCIMEHNQPQCGCRRGYTLADDGKTCLDINECTSNASNQCSHVCENIPGTYRCSCPHSMSLQNDERTCAECDNQHWGSDCSNVCDCDPRGSHRCDKVLGCVCHSGWTGDKCDQDKNECSTVTCQANSDCQNLPGTYRCQCRTGYSLSTDNTTCEEMNECSSTKDNICDHNCHNTEGSYFCTCKPGFVLEGKGTCRDIDECLLATSGCTQECTNTHGGYICDCFDGFTLDGSDGKSCIQMTKCSNTTRCSQGCRVSGGVEVCFCNPGYQLNIDGVTCDDIKECELSPPLCSQGCVESVGGYTCTCDDGFSLATDKSTCHGKCPIQI